LFVENVLDDDYTKRIFPFAQALIHHCHIQHVPGYAQHTEDVKLGYRFSSREAGTSVLFE